MGRRAEVRAEITPAEDVSSRLLGLAGLINLIHESLRSTLSIESLERVIVGVMVSRRALGFSRAILLRWDDKTRAFRLAAAVGAPDARAHARLREAMTAAEKALMAGGDEAPADEFALFSHDATEIRPKEFWSEMSERVRPFNELPQRLAEIEVKPSAMGEDFLARLMKQGHACLRADAAQIAASALPAELKAALAGGDSLWGRVATRRGSRMLLIADKSREAEPLDAVDELHMNWFRGQVAMALENAERYRDLKAANESLRDLDTLKGNFLATISHELRTPLTAISGFTRLLIENKGGPILPGQRQILDRVLAHSERLANVVNDLIEIAEIDSGSAVAMTLYPIDPVNVLMETLPKLEPRRASKGVKIQPVVTGPVPNIRGDAKGLSRIFYHLIDNAVKFSRDGGTVKIEFVVGDGEVAIKISDQGIGIPPDRLRQIFEAFYQVDSKLTRVYEGMGIGLTLTRKLVSSTGGRLVVVSSPGEGSTFTVIYPPS